MLEAASGRNNGIANSAYGLFTSDGTATVINVGFVPTIVEVFNETDNIVWRKIVSMGATICVKTVAAGTQTMDATTAITIGSNADNTVTLSAALCGTAKAISWRVAR
jgi:hypothetical protein